MNWDSRKSPFFHSSHLAVSHLISLRWHHLHGFFYWASTTPGPSGVHACVVTKAGMASFTSTRLLFILLPWSQFLLPLLCAHNWTPTHYSVPLSWTCLSPLLHSNFCVSICVGHNLCYLQALAWSLLSGGSGFVPRTDVKSHCTWWWVLVLQELLQGMLSLGTDAVL